MLNFLRRFTYQFKEYLILVLLVIISLTLLASNEKPEVKKIRTFAFGSFAILNSLLDSFGDLFTSDPSIDQLKIENAKLNLELNRLRKQGIENQNLRDMLSMKDSSRYQLIAADVVSKLVNKVQGSFIINKGSLSGVRIGMPVVNHQGLIGIISDVAGKFSVVKTLFNSSLNIAVTLQKINVDGVLNWNGKELIIKNIPTTYEIEVGDNVATSDFSTLFPPDIPVGIISEKESIALGLLHTLSVEPYADISAVSNLFIVNIIPSKQINQLEMNLMK
ncbi:MAG TPA: rod shape-determining protein MreC [Melioribacteraceae bacterium]|nr:rod shape-determining protein MreC [Melioribacteraceae bacterium]